MRQERIQRLIKHVHDRTTFFQAFYSGPSLSPPTLSKSIGESLRKQSVTESQKNPKSICLYLFDNRCIISESARGRDSLKSRGDLKNTPAVGKWNFSVGNRVSVHCLNSYGQFLNHSTYSCNNFGQVGEKMIFYMHPD